MIGVTTHPLVGEYQSEPSTPWECFDSGPADPPAPHMDNTLTNQRGHAPVAEKATKQ